MFSDDPYVLGWPGLRLSTKELRLNATSAIRKAMHEPMGSKRWWIVCEIKIVLSPEIGHSRVLLWWFLYGQSLKIAISKQRDDKAKKYHSILYWKL